MIEQHFADLRYLQFHHYLQSPQLRHGIFTRLGGSSQPPYQGLNTGAPHRGVPGDTIDNVISNRQRALQALTIADTPCVTLWQIHSAKQVIFERKDEWRDDWANHSFYERSWTPATIHKGDALLTNERGTAIALSFADCTPITLYDPVRQVIGIAHGGWRGTARGIALATIETMVERFGSQPSTILAGIAPAIGECCYEVSEEVQRLFLGHESFTELPTHEQYRKRVRESAVFLTRQLPHKNSLRLDLQATNRNQLLMAGLLPEHIEVTDICTSCHTDTFFSHRGEQGNTGRFPVIMALT